ncbi:30S ribosomal protein S5 [Candidatus Woesearchaeota archaeon]|nr:30S ribosomal protein S5 [Candidatus Woesearchaeota archaeon]
MPKEQKQLKEEKKEEKAQPASEEVQEEVESVAVVVPEEAPDIITPIAEEEVPVEAKFSLAVEQWRPKTEIGKAVKSGEVTSIDEVLDSGKKILEAEIVDVLFPNLESDLLMIGQSKGKFVGGQRRVFKQTQKKTKEGNKPKFATYAVVGNRDGIIGIGYGKSKETVPAREKALRNARLHIIKIRRGCGSWQCGCKQPHSIPFTVYGKCGSVEIWLMPAPKGKGLIVEKECQKILALAGIKDAWSKTKGKTVSKINLVNACFAALQELMRTKIQSQHNEALGVVEGSIGEIAHGNAEEESK